MRPRKPERNWMRFRFFLFIIGLLMAFGMITFQAYRIQIYHAPRLCGEAETIYKRRITLIPNRGSIFDRNGEDLAISLPVDSVFARPTKIEDPEETARKLGLILNRKPLEVYGKLAQDRPFVWIARQVVPTVGANVRAERVKGIGVLQETRRFYPNKELLSHVLGFVGVDGEGLEGLEYRYDHLLHGEESIIVVEMDAIGRELGPTDGLTVARKDGQNLVLTIHKDIQHVTEHQLEGAVNATGAKGGMAVVLNPRTGEVLAMANVPRFNPNKFAAYSHPILRNRCVANPFEPGSTIKPLMVAAALEEKAWKPSDTLYCEKGSYRVVDKVIHDIGRHGWLTIKGIIQRSSNIGAAKVGLSLGAECLYNYYQKFGLGRPTGIDLPGEAAGIMRPSKEWSRLEVATISFGQGVSATALQVASAFAALANDGRRMKPHIVKEVLNAQGKAIRRVEPEDLGPVVSPETAHTITKMLVDVVSENGTGSQAVIDGYKIAGKTGTAQKADLRSGGYLQGRYVASFVGYIPADDPNLCILVVIEEPQGAVLGGQIAAPVFREVAKDALGILGIYPDTRLLAMESSLTGESKHAPNPVQGSTEY